MATLVDPLTLRRHLGSDDVPQNDADDAAHRSTRRCAVWRAAAPVSSRTLTHDARREGRARRSDAETRSHSRRARGTPRMNRGPRSAQENGDDRRARWASASARVVADVGGEPAGNADSRLESAIRERRVAGGRRHGRRRRCGVADMERRAGGSRPHGIDATATRDADGLTPPRRAPRWQNVARRVVAVNADNGFGDGDVRY